MLSPICWIFSSFRCPSRQAALKQLAEKRPYLDLSRVGVYGWSWGGYTTIRAMLQAPDVYHVGIAGNTDGVGLEARHHQENRG